jgi:Fuc2NAc and GlcNAc transferase
MKDLIYALLVFLAAFTSAAVMTGVVRKLALRKGILDVPNERSSHFTVTPRGGGLAVAAVVLSGIALLALAGTTSHHFLVATIGGGGLVATVGWLDDTRHVPARWRFLVHAVAAGMAVAMLGGTQWLGAAAASSILQAVCATLAFLGLIWATNLYNFMDGIDGLAASTAVIAGLAATALLWRASSPELAFTALLLAAASAGFLVWNWAPARIFMGDCGSGLLGFLFGTLALASANASAVSILAWLTLFGAFLADATITLMRRVARGEPWYTAHRSHAYQRAVQYGWSHGRVTRSAVALNLILVSLAVTGEVYPEVRFATATAALAILGTVYAVIERHCPMHPRARREAVKDRRAESSK